MPRGRSRAARSQTKKKVPSGLKVHTVRKSNGTISRYVYLKNGQTRFVSKTYGRGRSASRSRSRSRSRSTSRSRSRSLSQTRRKKTTKKKKKASAAKRRSASRFRR